MSCVERRKCTTSLRRTKMCSTSSARDLSKIRLRSDPYLQAKSHSKGSKEQCYGLRLLSQPSLRRSHERKVADSGIAAREVYRLEMPRATATRSSLRKEAHRQAPAIVRCVLPPCRSARERELGAHESGPPYVRECVRARPTIFRRDSPAVSSIFYCCCCAHPPPAHPRPCALAQRATRGARSPSVGLRPPLGSHRPPLRNEV